MTNPSPVLNLLMLLLPSTMHNSHILLLRHCHSSYLGPAHCAHRLSCLVSQLICTGFKHGKHCKKRLKTTPVWSIQMNMWIVSTRARSCAWQAFYSLPAGEDCETPMHESSWWKYTHKIWNLNPSLVHLQCGWHAFGWTDVKGVKQGTRYREYYVKQRWREQARA